MCLHDPGWLYIQQSNHPLLAEAQAHILSWCSWGPISVPGLVLDTPDQGLSLPCPIPCCVWWDRPGWSVASLGTTKQPTLRVPCWTKNRCYANCSRLEFSFWVSKNAMVKSKVKQMLSFQILNSQVNVHCRLLIIIWTSANEWCKWKFCYCTEPSFHQTYEESSRPLGYIFLLSKFTTCVNQVATFMRF